MKFWRVEDINGVGLHQKVVEGGDPDFDIPFPSAFNRATMLDWHAYDNDLAAHRPPDDDVRLMSELEKTGKDISEFIFVFTSPRQMREYLYRDSWISKLNEFGMIVSVFYETEGVVVGDTQALLPKHACRLETYPIGEYFGVR